MFSSGTSNQKRIKKIDQLIYFLNIISIYTLLSANPAVASLPEFRAYAEPDATLPLFRQENSLPLFKNHQILMQNNVFISTIENWWQAILPEECDVLQKCELQIKAMAVSCFPAMHCHISPDIKEARDSNRHWKIIITGLPVLSVENSAGERDIIFLKEVSAEPAESFYGLFNDTVSSGTLVAGDNKIPYFEGVDFFPLSNSKLNIMVVGSEQNAPVELQRAFPAIIQDRDPLQIVVVQSSAKELPDQMQPATFTRVFIEPLSNIMPENIKKELLTVLNSPASFHRDDLLEPGRTNVIFTAFQTSFQEEIPSLKIIYGHWGIINASLDKLLTGKALLLWARFHFLLEMNRAIKNGDNTYYSSYIPVTRTEGKVAVQKNKKKQAKPASRKKKNPKNLIPDSNIPEGISAPNSKQTSRKPPPPGPGNNDARLAPQPQAQALQPREQRVHFSDSIDEIELPPFVLGQDGIFQWTIKNFSSIKAIALQYRAPNIHNRWLYPRVESRKFYDEDRGYILKLTVFPNGRHDAEGEWGQTFGVFFNVEHSEDAGLLWPMPPYMANFTVIGAPGFDDSAYSIDSIRNAGNFVINKPGPGRSSREIGISIPNRLLNSCIQPDDSLIIRFKITINRDMANRFLPFGES